MKPAGKTSKALFSAAWTGLALCLLAGCASSSSQKKIYDRYAARVAELNRQSKTASSATPAAASSSRSSAKPSEPMDRRPVKTAAAKPEPAKAPPVQMIAPKPAEKTETKPSEAVEPIPAPSPQPAPAFPPSPPVPAPTAPAPVQAAEAAPIQPAAPAPVQVVEAAPVQPAAPAPVQVSAPAPQPASPPAPKRRWFWQAKPADDGAARSEGLAADAAAYILKQGDVVQIALRGIPSAEAIEAVVDENGMISMPFINEVKAAGQSASELARNIRQIYMDQGIYQNISVTVVVPTRYYFIQGEIRGPGRFQIVSATRLSQAIASAGGYTEYASGQVLIRRGGKVFKTVKNARRLERTPEDDVPLEPDDIIEVKRSLW